MSNRDPYGIIPSAPGHDSFGLAAPLPMAKDVTSMRIGEKTWGNILSAAVDVPASSTTAIVVPSRQYLSISDVPRVWALRVSCTWENFDVNHAAFPTDDAEVGFTVTAGVGQGMIPHTYLFQLLALDGFAELFLEGLPAQAIYVQAGLQFQPANATARRQQFTFAASAAPYTRLRSDE